MGRQPGCLWRDRNETGPVVATLRSQHRHSVVFRLLWRLDMDGHDQLLHLPLQRLLDAVADHVGFRDRHGAGHDEMELQEGQPAGMAGAQIVRLQRAGALSATSSRMRFTTAGCGAASIRPPTELEIIAMPDHST